MWASMNVVHRDPHSPLRRRKVYNTGSFSRPDFGQLESEFQDTLEIHSRS